MDTTSLKRYTDLASLIDILKNKRLTLLSPFKWEDKNDSYYLKRYREKKGFKSLYALCFTMGAEASHHWKVFSPGNAGVCVKIHKGPFIESLNGITNILHDEVTYKLIDVLEKNPPEIEQLPFLKRFPFQDEKEYRVICVNKGNNEQREIPFEISLIKGIVLSHSLPAGLTKPIIDLLHSIEGCSKLKIYRTTLNDNARWKKVIDHVAVKK
jgi:hypothetical protein